MKKSILITVFSVLLFSCSGWSQCTSCYQSTINLSANASGVGQNNTANGQAAFAMGNGSISNGAASGAFGINSEAYAAASFAMGRKIKSSATSAIVLGSGYAFTQYLINGNDNTLMIGFNSTAPTFFISKSLSDATHQDRTGKVGIGNVTAPEAKLHIKADADENADIFLQSSGWINNSSANIYIGTLGHGVSASATEGLIFNSEKNYLFKRGNVGFGLDPEELPAARLHIKAATTEVASVFIEPAVWDDGTSTGGGFEVTKGALALSTSGAYLFLGNEFHGIGAIKSAGLIFNTESYYVFNDGFLKIGKDARAGYILVCTDNEGTAKWVEAPATSPWLSSGINDIYFNKGKVGIGTINTTDYALAVKGKIITDEVMVRHSSLWSDFVFGTSFVLKPLAEVEQYINDNKHLPDVPSAKEVSENGYGVSEMNAILLQKIEELTLYIIDQEKRLQKQEEILEQQQEFFNSLNTNSKK
ncbi:MAG: hypothetical protein A2W85_14025 [Bacteroidetes bacterium GWF2_41_31]|nr:MAG: hypothetical protein A2W85_14025 [Bacteroidetes bacterium GWF2_41_31]OFZ09686.1 MAG: hypothetical protein A2338_04445 [Bacteroidetes bacterium RIFOXYB12_FULL_41_6]